MIRWITKSGAFLQLVLFTILASLLWIPAFVPVREAVCTDADGPLYQLLAEGLSGFPEIAVSLALAITLLLSFGAFYIFRQNGFFGRSNFLPSVIVLLAFSWNDAFMTLHAQLPAGIFVLLALNFILRMYGRQAAYTDIFSASFSLGMASLFYLPLAYLLLLIWFTFITYRVSSWREYAISIVGFTLPFLYYMSWLFWNDQFRSGMEHLGSRLIRFQIPERLPLNETVWLWFSAFVAVVSIIAVLNAMGDKLINLRKRAWVMLSFSLTSGILLVLSGWPILSWNYLFALPMAFFLTGSLTMMRKPFFFELIALVYFVLFVLIKLYPVLAPVFGLAG
jgi:hypothetical protein